MPAAPTSWTPSADFIAGTNIAWLMKRAGMDSWEALHAWSVQYREDYWRIAIERLGLRFQKPFSRVADFSRGVEHPVWLPGARLNIAESCLVGTGDEPAIICQKEGGPLQTVTRAELAVLAGRVAAGLAAAGCGPGDRIALFMPMTVESVAIYLGILQAGCVAVGIADSFRPPEIAVRLKIAEVKMVFTQEFSRRGGKEIPLYQSVVDAEAPLAVVLESSRPLLRGGDMTWESFLPAEPRHDFAECDPADAINILFSSGTTGEPKAIPWTQTTPIKCAADAHFHHNVRPGSVLVWPTNIGWMMGPWLIFASLLNRSAMGLWQGAPVGPAFGKFVQDSRATMLGVIPTLVKAWREENCFHGLDLSRIEAFSSTGECSNADDMRWLMEQAGWRPVIEYCGGTEIGGGYLTGTMTRPCVPGTFNAKALGLDMVILNEEGNPAEEGEVFLIPPSIGLSTSLLNRDHHEAYHAGTPQGPDGCLLRRHGDRIAALPDGRWQAHGRSDDTMNLGGIKVSSAEIERAVRNVSGVRESAAIAVSPEGGPSLLVLYIVSTNGEPPERSALQQAIRSQLNPLFKIHDVVAVEKLPRTASNKVLRRVLRNQYSAQS